MAISSCCGAPIVVELQSDLPNYTDDEYDFKVPVWVCSQCGSIIARNPHPEGKPHQEGPRRPEK